MKDNLDFMTFVWNYCKGIIDVFWLGIGKPIKHSYDFFRYIRSEVGTVVGICIAKCCKKSTQKVKIAGKMVLEQVKTKVDQMRDSDDESADGLILGVRKRKND